MKVLTWATLGVILATSTALTPATARERHREAGVRTQSHAAHAQRGRASFYSNQFHGQRMANGKRFDRNSNAAASRTLPLGTRARVRNLENGRTALVTIQDRGPHLRSRVLDVSPRTASQLGMRQQGTAMVEITPLGVPRSDPS
jgi:rare lipoprotein A